MKKHIHLGVALFLAAASVAHADPIGQWMSEPSDRGEGAGGYVVVDIKPCEASSQELCGIIVRTVDKDGQDVVEGYDGEMMLKDLKPNGEAKWSGGTIWAPDEGKTYNSKMTELGDGTLKVFGCLFKGMLCRGQIWKRVEGS